MKPEQSYMVLFRAEGNFQRFYFQSGDAASNWCDRLDREQVPFTCYQLNEIRRENFIA